MAKLSIRKAVERCRTCEGQGRFRGETCPDCAGVGEKELGIVSFFEGAERIAVCVRSTKQETTTISLPTLGMQLQTRPFAVLHALWLHPKIDPSLLGVRARPADLEAALERCLQASAGEGAA